jgi:hypothetical protein
MSVRLDSNQRPLEPHSGGIGSENRKNRRFLNLQIPCFPYFTLRNPHFPQNLLSFLPFPTCGIRPCGAPEPGRVAPGAVSEVSWPGCPRAVRYLGRCDLSAQHDEACARRWLGLMHASYHSTAECAIWVNTRSNSAPERPSGGHNDPRVAPERGRWTMTWLAPTRLTGRRCRRTIMRWW